MEQVNIAIVDQNQFFKLGLSLAMKQGFAEHGVRVNFTSEKNANVIFRAPDDRVSINFCHAQLLQGEFYSIPLYFSILEHNASMPKIHCNLEAGSITRKEGVEKVIAKVMACYRGKAPFTSDHCPRCRTQLTFSEGKVCRLIKCGYSQNQMAMLLGISPKTVSIHKRSAMRKLNIHNNIDFLRWLKMHSDAC
ncbi:MULTISPECIES: helix-turn-helix transcriptional regulator [unclassified Serratia (in: enterobacteria)]|uniref:helix-turn-helix transcriptional regulator n=1 Tax=unclassified Serratia (in: enterobacteria) TaxID=2647522 RepID=UPI002ED1A735|nr:LuxR C-terminal-related transcriptional regulator [Serratia sp. C2(2)]MEE4445844.1 LuxR C-terminal-related transcriptional regulator [Serratia sp. C2(1)]